jgi:uncharacterized protein YlbG (UPF0298 family)
MVHLIVVLSKRWEHKAMEIYVRSDRETRALESFGELWRALESFHSHPFVQKE